MTAPADIFRKGNNNFNAIRLIAALVVIYAHSYVISPRPGRFLPLFVISDGLTQAGELSVVVFFFLSGALVTKSLVDSRDMLGFLLKRIFRVYPALIVVSFFSAYVVSWVFGGLSIGQAFTSPSAFRYFSMNAFGLWNEHFIDGVYLDHPEHALNGSLWSVTLELRLYAVLAIIGLLGIFSGPRARIVVLAFLLIGEVFAPGAMPLIGTNHALLGNFDFQAFSVIFFAGGLFYLLREDIRVGFAAVPIGGAFIVLTHGTPAFIPAIFVTAIAFALWLGTRSWLIRWPVTHDYSYGVYLYGWPAEQIIVALSPARGPTGNAILAGILALALAALSWHLLEKPSIDFAHRLAQRDLSAGACWRWVTGRRAGGQA